MKLRTKIILIFLGIALLPFLPIGWLASDLVQQVYFMGVNPDVETALQTGVNHGRELYQNRKIQLSESLSEIIRQSDIKTVLADTTGADLKLPETNTEWHYLSVQIYDADRKRIFSNYHPEIENPYLDASRFADVEKTAEKKIIFANRAENRFLAIEKQTANNATYYWVLIAASNGTFLKDVQQNIDAFKTFRTLSLSPASILQSHLYAFLLISIIIVLIAVAIATWLSKRLTAPISELVAGTQEVGKGNLDYRIARLNSDEIGELTNQFNQMAGALKNYQEKTIYLEKMAAWQEIARRLAHEIKNPLTPIQLTVQEMVDQYSGNDAEYAQLITECHSIVSEEIENLRRLVQEFSAFGRMPELQRHPADIHQIISDVCQLYPNTKIRLNFAEDIPALNLDEDRIRRVLINLIGNAIQADAKNQEIVIQTLAEKEGCQVSLTDKGSGISLDHQAKIFQPYFSTKTNGIGLGLAITRKMIEEHDGKITVQSQIGRGSTFTFTLPFKKG